MYDKKAIWTPIDGREASSTQLMDKEARERDIIQKKLAADAITNNNTKYCLDPLEGIEFVILWKVESNLIRIHELKQIK